MFLQEISPNISAYQLAKNLADKLGKQIPLSDGVESGCFFQFDPDEIMVVCSSTPIETIAEKEAAHEETTASYRALLKMADDVIGETIGIPECVRYAVFSCLHEFGHYEQALSWSHAKVEQMGVEREELIDEAKAEAQRHADRGMFRPFVYVLYEQRYRSIFIEKDADERACEMLSSIAGL